MIVSLIECRCVVPKIESCGCVALYGCAFAVASCQLSSSLCFVFTIICESAHCFQVRICVSATVNLFFSFFFAGSRKFSIYANTFCHSSGHHHSLWNRIYNQQSRYSHNADIWPTQCIYSSFIRSFLCVAFYTLHIRMVICFYLANTNIYSCRLQTEYMIKTHNQKKNTYRSSINRTDTIYFISS